jgi:hypothetical protein
MNYFMRVLVRPFILTLSPPRLPNTDTLAKPGFYFCKNFSLLNHYCFSCYSLDFSGNSLSLQLTSLNRLENSNVEIMWSYSAGREKKNMENLWKIMIMVGPAETVEKTSVVRASHEKVTVLFRVLSELLHYIFYHLIDFDKYDNWCLCYMSFTICHLKSFLFILMLVLSFLKNQIRVWFISLRVQQREPCFE